MSDSTDGEDKFMDALEAYIDANIDLHENNYHDRDVKIHFGNLEMNLRKALRGVLECKGSLFGDNYKANFLQERLLSLLALSVGLSLISIVVSAINFFRG